MATSVQYIEQALVLGEKEMAALSQGDVEQAIELAEQRAQLTAQAWEVRRPEDKSVYGEKVIQLLQLQDILAELATRQKNESRNALVESRKQHQRLTGYRNAVAHAL